MEATSPRAELLVCCPLVGLKLTLPMDGKVRKRSSPLTAPVADWSSWYLNASPGPYYPCATQTELAKPEPDLAALAGVSDQVQAQNMALRKQARAAWLALYATFSTDQKTIVRDAINARISRMQAFRQRTQGNAPGTSAPMT